MVVRKGTNKGVDSYSGFGDAFGGRWEKTELADVLRAAGITDVFVTGLATDFCVSFTAKDAVKNGMGWRRPRRQLRSADVCLAGCLPQGSTPRLCSMRPAVSPRRASRPRRSNGRRLASRW